QGQLTGTSQPATTTPDLSPAFNFSPAKNPAALGNFPGLADVSGATNNLSAPVLSGNTGNTGIGDNTGATGNIGDLGGGANIGRGLAPALVGLTSIPGIPSVNNGTSTSFPSIVWATGASG